MRKPNKSKVDGGGASRNAGGRPRKQLCQPSSEETPSEPLSTTYEERAGASSAPAHAKPPNFEPPPAPLSPPSPEQLPWEPTPTDPPTGGWSYCSPVSFVRCPSSFVHPRFLTLAQVDQKEKLRLRHPYNNGICSCQSDGLHSSGDDSEHLMFCQLYKCYAHEVGCCDGRIYAAKSKHDPTMTWWRDCECIAHAFDPDYDIGGKCTEILFRSARRRTRSHTDEDGLVDRPGGRALRCECGCGYVGGPYVPMCPFRPHGVTGLARGDMYKRLRLAWGVREGLEWPDPPHMPPSPKSGLTCSEC